MPSVKTVTIFCKVIDNFGDIGVCWRLARQLVRQEKRVVTLWVDDLSRFKQLRNRIDIHANVQELDGMIVRHWVDDAAPSAITPDDLVIEAFGCRLPDAFVAAMARRLPQSVWINLEYLSAESWVGQCHRLPSPHPVHALTKFFYFPGFTVSTGGLTKEAGLDQARDSLQNDDAAREVFLQTLDVKPSADQLLVSLFCYGHAPIASLFDAIQRGGRSTLCLVPEGVGSNAVAQFLRQPAVRGMKRIEGQLTVQVVPFLSPDSYDKLLWCCDLNLVRGEDSLVRGLWAARPFIWQLYPQEEQAHLPKLEAFLAQWASGLPADAARTMGQCWHEWNGAGSAQWDWPGIVAALPAWKAHSRTRSAAFAANGELARGLVEFAGKIG